MQSWHRNRDDLTAFFDFPVEIRMIIYTTIWLRILMGEFVNTQKNKMSFPIDDVLRNSVWLALQELWKEVDNVDKKLGFGYESIYCYI